MARELAVVSVIWGELKGGRKVMKIVNRELGNKNTCKIYGESCLNWDLNMNFNSSIWNFDKQNQTISNKTIHIL